MYKCTIFLLPLILLASAQVGWAANVTPTWRANSEPDLAGYKVYYGTQPRAQAPYSQIVLVNDRSATSWSIILSSGTYYFALTAFDTSGNESGFSTEVSATVSASDPPGKPGRPLLVQ